MIIESLIMITDVNKAAQKTQISEILVLCSSVLKGRGCNVVDQAANTQVMIKGQRQSGEFEGTRVNGPGLIEKFWALLLLFPNTGKAFAGT